MPSLLPGFVRLINNNNPGELEQVALLDTQTTQDFPWGAKKIYEDILSGQMGVVVFESYLYGVVGFLAFQNCVKFCRVLRMGVRAWEPDDEVAFRRRGVGRRLIGCLSPKRRWVMNVSDELTEAHLFLRNCGFKATEVLKGKGELGKDLYCFMRPPLAPRAQADNELTTKCKGV